jgi:hypothetical protein
VFHLPNKTNRKVATITQCDWPAQQSNFIMNEENEIYYDSDEDYYEDFDDDEIDDTETNHLTEANMDTLIHTIRMYGSKYHYHKIEELIRETNEEAVFQWFQVFESIRDPTDSKRQTFNQIEALLDAQSLQTKITTPVKTPPFHHETIATPSSSHDEDPKEEKHNKNSEQPQYTPVLPPSNISYYDLSPYVNTVEVFKQNIILLQTEIRRILLESDITDSTLTETTVNKELKALTGYDPYIAFQGDFRTAPTKIPTNFKSCITISTTPQQTLLTFADVATFESKTAATTKPSTSLTPTIPTTLAAITPTAPKNTLTDKQTPSKNNQLDIIAAMRSASKHFPTRELTTALTKVAFQQWKIVIQDAIIQEAQLNITSKAKQLVTTRQTQAMPTRPALTKLEAMTTVGSDTTPEKKLKQQQYKPHQQQ